MKRAALGLALAAAVAAGCHHDGPISGELSVRLSSPRSDRAILFRVVGPQHGVTAATGSTYRVFSDTSAVGDTSWITVIAAPGGALAVGEIARLTVADVRRVGNYTATVADVATATYAVGDTAGVFLTIVRP